MRAARLLVPDHTQQPGLPADDALRVEVGQGVGQKRPAERAGGTGDQDRRPRHGAIAGQPASRWENWDGFYHRSDQGGGKWEFKRPLPDVFLETIVLNTSDEPDPAHPTAFPLRPSEGLPGVELESCGVLTSGDVTADKIELFKRFSD